MSDTNHAQAPRPQPRSIAAVPRPTSADDTLGKLADVLGRTADKINAMTPVQAIAVSLKSLTYDQAQEVGSGLAKAIEANKDKDTGFDFANAPIKMAPVLTHLVQTWASSITDAMMKETE